MLAFEEKVTKKDIQYACPYSEAHCSQTFSRRFIDTVYGLVSDRQATKHPIIMLWVVNKLCSEKAPSKWRLSLCQ